MGQKNTQSIEKCPCKSKAEARALAGFLWNEMERHYDDIQAIIDDLAELDKKWGVKPDRVRRFVTP